MHTFAIVVHATSAIAAFIIGIVFIFQSNTLRQLQLGRAIVVLLMLMEVFLVIAILSHVTSLPTITQIIFGGLVILGGYMIWRAVQAVSDETVFVPPGPMFGVYDLACGSSRVGPARTAPKSRSRD